MSLEDLQAEHDKLERDNEASYKQWLEATGIPMDTRDMRLNLFLEHIYEGDPEGRLAFEIVFHKKVQEALDEHWKKWRNHQAQQVLVTPPKKAGLVDGHGRPLNSGG